MRATLALNGLMTDKLRTCYGITAPWNIVMKALQELDPVAVLLRQSHKQFRRSYISDGPNDCWHIDGYDKIKQFGLRMLWLYSNSDPFVIAQKCVEDQGFVVQRKIRSDCGSKNTIIAAIQCLLRRNHHTPNAGLKAHSFGSSHKNQRQETWWVFLHKSVMSWIIGFFKKFRMMTFYILTMKFKWVVQNITLIP